jgi:hypothetical protein
LYRLVSSTHNIFARQSTESAYEPDLVARHALNTIIEHAVLVAIRDADTASREEACQPTFCPAPPADPLPFLFHQLRFSRDRRLIGDVVFAWLSSLRDGEDQCNVGGIMLDSAGESQKCRRLQIRPHRLAWIVKLTNSDNWKILSGKRTIVR